MTVEPLRDALADIREADAAYAVGRGVDAVRALRRPTPPTNCHAPPAVRAIQTSFLNQSRLRSSSSSPEP